MAIQQLQQLSEQDFRCEADARLAAECLNNQWKYQHLDAVRVVEQAHITNQDDLAKIVRPKALAIAYKRMQ